MILKKLFEFIQENCGPEHQSLYEYTELETKFGNRCEIRGPLCVLMQMADNGLELLVLSQEPQVVKHASYLVNMLALFTVTKFVTIQLKAHGRSLAEVFNGVSSQFEVVYDESSLDYFFAANEVQVHIKRSKNADAE
jgi:hypothetical protein